MVRLPRQRIKREKAPSPGVVAMSDDELRSELDSLIGQLDTVVTEDKLSGYKPYAKQAEFHEAGAYVRERLFMAANQSGKCVSFQTLIQHPDGSYSMAGKLYERGRPFRVMAWDGRRAVEAWAVRPIRKPREPIYRIWLSSGLSFECAGNHRVLTPQGWTFVSTLFPFVPILPASIGERARLVHGGDVLNWWERRQGSLADCLEDRRLCDERLPRDEDSDLALLPSQADARRHGGLSYNSDDPGDRCTNTFRQAPGLPSNRDVDRRHAVPFAVFSGPGESKSDTLCIERRREFPLPSNVAVFDVRSNRVSGLRQSRSGAWLTSPNGDANQIIAYELVGVQEVYDFTVPGYANYITAGVIHHNTYCAGYETAMHLTGLYPAWWKGRRFTKPVRAWAAGKTQETTRDVPQKMLLGQAKVVNDRRIYGTGTIPKAAIAEEPKLSRGVSEAVDYVLIKHVSGGNSYLQFKSYDEGRLKWQGETLDFIWFDEEPPADIYTEGLTRTNATGGMVYMTFTPLLGMSEIVSQFLRSTSAGKKVITMTLADAEHYTPEQRKAIEESYPDHERDARVNGVPMMGEGRVFAVPESALRFSMSDFPTGFPMYWPRIGGVDFGDWDHPTAAVWIAWDRDTDIAYVYDCYRQSKQTLATHAAAIRDRGKNILFAWPHDGMKHDRTAGDPISKLYRDNGVNMMHEHATHVEGGMSLEADVAMMIERMHTGRIRVAEHLNPWWEEFRIYHRKDGRIVPVMDDALSATRYALRCLRFARIDEDRKPIKVEMEWDAFA